VNVEESYEGSQLFAEAASPTIFALDFRDQATQISRLNQQVDVDHTYTFYVDANSTLGMTDIWNNAVIELYAWFDEGKIGANSNCSPIITAPPENRTRQFVIKYNVTTKASTMLYPTGIPQEFALDSVWEDPVIYINQRRHVFFNVTFKAQTRAANGSGFMNGPPFVGNIWDKNPALNDPYSWDFNVTLMDSINKTSRNTSYEEFGIKQAVSITASGNPSGSGPPGTSNILLSNPSIVTYSANTPYLVNVSLKTNLLMDGIGPDLIGASNISVRNANTQSNATNSDIPLAGAPSPFVGAGEVNCKCAWGRTIGGVTLPPPSNGTIAAGPWGSDYSTPSNPFTQVDWWATIPAGIPKGTYWATITFTIAYP
jgi:hypothetical protein